MKTFSAFGFHAGWEQPHFFATQGELKTTPVCYTRKHWHDAVGREVDAILNRVAVADLTPFGKFMLEGPGATKFLSSMVANTLPKVGTRNMFLIISNSEEELDDAQLVRKHEIYLSDIVL